MDKMAHYTAQIRQHYPQLPLETVALNQEGQYNDVLVINQELIFRFARYPVAVQTLRQEVAILRAIQKEVTLPVPNPIYQQLDTQVVGEAFMGYQMLPGLPLWRERFQGVGEVGRRTIAGQLASFLQGLHGVPPDQIDFVEKSAGDSPESYADLYHRIRRHLFPQMRPEARKKVARHFESFLDNPAVYQYQPRLRHGDFGTGTLLFDPLTQAMTGVIDFGFAGLGDPAADFAGLWASFGEAFYWQCAKTYPEMAHALPRVQFYVGTFALQEALFGLEQGDEDAYASGMADYL